MLKSRQAAQWVKIKAYGLIMIPTDEQRGGIDLAKAGENCKLIALAGAGKTQTLIEIAKALGPRGLYFAFNRAAKEDAKKRFPQNYRCLTGHGLAYGPFGVKYADANKLGQKHNFRELASRFHVEQFKLANMNTLQASQVVAFAIQTIECFCRSADEEMNKTHLPYAELWSLDDQVLDQPDRFKLEDLESLVLELAMKLWTAMLDKKDPTPVSHDFYLKLWAMTDPQLNVDYILYDEAQDANSVLVSVLNRQSSQVILVGDPFQQIYSWRGAVNAMDTLLPDAKIAYLTQSFRFGPLIADAATVMLQHFCGSDLTVKGNPNVLSRLSVRGRPDAFLHRTNGGCLQSLTGLLDSGVRQIHFDKSKGMIEMIRGIVDLKANRKSIHPALLGFKSFDDIMDFLANDPVNELQTVIGLIKKYGDHELIRILTRIAEVKEEDAQVILSTGHSSKGREWNSVQLGSDFVNKDGDIADGEDSNLVYVAVTRAKKELEMGRIVEVIEKRLTAPEDIPEPND